MPASGQGSSFIGHSKATTAAAFFVDAKWPDGSEVSAQQHLHDHLNTYPHPSTVSDPLPETLVGLDGSTFEGSIDGDAPTSRFPSARAGLINVAHLEIDVNALAKLNQKAFMGHMVDPRLLRQAISEQDSLCFWVNSSGITPKGAHSITDGFRTAVRDALRKPQARIPACAVDSPLNVTTGWSLLDVLYWILFRMEALGLASSSDFFRATGGTISAITLIPQRCPNVQCVQHHSFPSTTPIQLSANDRSCVRCPACNEAFCELDATKLLREFEEDQPNAHLIGRLSLVFEHLRGLQLLLHHHGYMPNIASARLSKEEHLARRAVVVDGPLALFGQTQHLVPAMRSMVHELIRGGDNHPWDHMPWRCGNPTHGNEGALMFGVIKTGALVDFMREVDRRKPIPAGSYWVVDDEARYKWIMPKARRKNAKQSHGAFTHYGHDVVVKTHQGQLLLISAPLPLPLSKKSKTDDGLRDAFLRARKKAGIVGSEQHRYLLRILNCVEQVQSVIFGGTTIPQNMAHDSASISHNPSGRILVAAVREKRIATPK